MIAALLIGAGAGATFAIRAGLFRGPPGEDYVTQVCEAAHARFAGVPVLPVESRDDIRSRLAGAEFDPSVARLSAGQLASLYEEAADFLWLRLALRDRQRYMEWRRARGDAPHPLEFMIHQSMVGRVHQIYFDEPVPPDADFDSLFARFWDAGWDYGNGYNRLRALATGAPGIHMTCGVVTPSNPRPPLHDGEIGETAWHGAIAHTLRSWYRPAITADAELRERRRALVAGIAIVADYEAGPRRPLGLRFVWSERLQRWSLTGVFINNVKDSRVSGLEY